MANSRTNQSHRRQLSRDDYLTAIEKECGVATSIAQRLGISRQAVHKRINADAELLAAMSEAADTLVDMAEGVLIKKLRAGDRVAAVFVLSTKGKNRGWGREAASTVPTAAPTHAEPACTCEVTPEIIEAVRRKYIDCDE